MGGSDDDTNTLLISFQLGVSCLLALLNERRPFWSWLLEIDVI